MKFLKKEEQKAAFQMAPMIDVVFLLLIFFMSVSTFHQLESIEDISLPVADKSKTLEKTPQNLVINIKRDGAIIMNQNLYKPTQIARILSETPIEQSVVIRADKDIFHGRVAEILSACAAAGVWDISIATYQEEKR